MALKRSLLAAAAASAWLVLGAMEILGTAITRQSLSPDVLPAVGGMVTTGFLATLALYWALSRLQGRLEGGALVAGAVLACLGASILRTGITGALWYAGLHGFWGEGVRWQRLLTGVLWQLIQFGFCAGLYFALSYAAELREQKEKTLRATALAHEAQWQMLRYQLNPHFLFNALNSIRAMALEDVAKSRQMITRLAEFLRYSLDADVKETTIGGEIAAIRSYLEIQHIRFERKLEVRTEIDPEAEPVAIPCFLIHPLVENAIKYGMDTSPMPLRVVVAVSHEEGRLRIQVRNTGRLAPNNGDGLAEGTGTGLKNIAQRLELGFPGRHAFKIYEEDGWVSAEMELELEREPS